MKKWLIGWVCAALASVAAGQYVVDFEGDGEELYTWGPETIALSGMNWEFSAARTGDGTSDWKNGLRSGRMHGEGVSSMTMLEDLTNGLGTLSFQYRRYGTEDQVDWKAEYSTDGGTGWTQVGSDFTAPASDDVQTFSEDVNVYGNVRVRIKRATESGLLTRRLNIDDITMTFTGPLEYHVSVDRTNGFQVLPGESGTITATAANGTPPYGYAWETTMAEGDYEASQNVFTIRSNAAPGDYTATVAATDGASRETDRSVTFTVVAPTPVYAIAIMPPVNGAVTTTPADEAEEGQEVTIHATPAEGYLLGTVAVVDTAMNPVAVADMVFTMPASAVTVSVAFDEYVPSKLFISEVADPSDNANARFVELYNAGATGVDLEAGSWYLACQVNGGDYTNLALTGTVAAGQTHVVARHADQFAASYPEAPAPDQISGVVNGNGNDGYFLYRGGDEIDGFLEEAYGVPDQDGLGTSWDYEDARAVRREEVAEGNRVWTASEWIVQAPAGTADMTPGVHPDSPSEILLSFDKDDGFTVWRGSPETLAATAEDGVEPYVFSWETTLAEGAYSSEGHVFTIRGTAAVGAYSATVRVVDDTLVEAEATLSFEVKALPPIASIAFMGDGSGDFAFQVPDDFSLVRVEGAHTATDAVGDFAWTTLAPDTDYIYHEPTGEIRILTDSLGAGEIGRMIRIWVVPVQ
jgi:hypothetical protein